MYDIIAILKFLPELGEANISTQGVQFFYFDLRMSNHQSLVKYKCHLTVMKCMEMNQILWHTYQAYFVNCVTIKTIRVNTDEL